MTTVYADMCADLFHFGHVRFLRAARALGSRLIVGIHSDEDIRIYKRTPVLSMKERIEVVEACKYVDRVIECAPLQPTDSYLRSMGVEVVCHGDDLSPDRLEFFYGGLSGSIPIVLVEYTTGISTSDIISRLDRIRRSSG